MNSVALRHTEPVAVPEDASRPSIVSVEGLTIGTSGKRPVVLVRDISFNLERGRTLALVGESGSGKSLTALSLLGLLPEPSVRLFSGKILFGGQDIAQLSSGELRAIRGGKIGMIFQEPLSALNPVMTVGDQIREAVVAHEPLKGKAIDSRVIELLELVRMPDPVRRAREYPHRLSGGMRQRVLIAIAMAGRPQVLIADEPTTALDVTVQAEIMDMLRQLQRQFDLALLLITHDFGLVADYADDVAVLYAGQIAEQGPAGTVLGLPLHPYTRGLLGARPHTETWDGPRRRLTEILGSVPAPTMERTSCAFAPRCPIAAAPCTAAVPELRPVRATQYAACFKAGEYR